MSNGADWQQKLEIEEYEQHFKDSMKKEITQEILKEIIRYDSKTGKLYWKKRSYVFFNGSIKRAIHSMKSWNKKFADKEAFIAHDSKGYFRGAIFHRLYKAHRIIWLLVYGENPNVIDHIDGNKENNRIDNLRNVTHQENQKNAKKSKNNTSGITGLSWSKERKKWEVKIMSDGKTINLGRYLDKNEAILTRKKAEKDFGFHENHGR